MFSLRRYHHRRQNCLTAIVFIGIFLGVTISQAQDTSTSPVACANPNPRHAIISQDIVEFTNDLADGSFEHGQAEIVLLDAHDPALNPADVTLDEVAARTGALGYVISAGNQQGIVFAVKEDAEKGENIRFSIWARSVNGPAQIRPLVFWSQGQDELPPPDVHAPVTVGVDWTQITVETATTQGARSVWFGLEIGPNTTLYLEDAQIAFPLWRKAEYAAGTGRLVGGIEVPPEPTAPVHISFLIHIEDPALITRQEAYFQQKTAVFRELARIFYRHGGFLTIQPEEDWVRAAESGFHPGLLAQLAADFDVVYSTHTHGPACRDDRGRLRSSADCNVHREWDRNIVDDDILEYVGNLRNLISATSGQTVSDHNGNFTFRAASRFAEIPMQTWSAYKNFNTQRTYDWLIINPWRPGEGNANDNILHFVTHDPTTNIVYIPGWSQALTRHPDRALSRTSRILSQVIRFADPDRVNTFYFVLHVDHFYSRANDPSYLAYDTETGEISYGAEFEQQIRAWEAVLTELVDPLVREGYLEWTSLPEMGALYRQWEIDCQTD